MTATTHKPTAADAYISAQQTAADQIAAIVELLAQHHDETPADNVSWGHVGDLGYVNAELSAIISFLAGSES